MNMNTITDKQKYTILKRKTIACRIIDIEKRPSLFDKEAEYCIVKIGHYDNGEFIYGKCLSINDFYEQYNELHSAMINRTKYLMQKLLIKPAIKVYHIWTWDDYFRKKCSNFQIGEIERTSDGNPRIYEEFIYYTKETTQINEQKIDVDIHYGGVIQNYIPINDPNVESRLAYRNMSRKIYKNNSKQDEIYDDYDYEDNHEDIDRTPEDIVMSALENGNGDSLGF